MKTAVLFTLVLVSALLMGCTSDPCKTDCCCGELKANCCGWDFYKPCRMVRGVDQSAECQDPCGTQVVLTPCDTGAPAVAPVESAPAESAPVEEAPMEEAPAAEPVADYGVAPTGR